jgi:large subunit ribosomal protein L10
MFRDQNVGFLVDFRGMDVAAVTDLRRKLHGANTAMKVLKNRLAKIAMKGTAFEPLADQLTETRAFVFGKEPVGPAKIVIKYQQDNEKFKLIAGVLVTAGAGTLLDAARVKALSSLPSREELLAKLLFLFKAPQTQFVRTLNEVPAKFVRALAAVRDQKQKQA